MIDIVVRTVDGNELRGKWEGTHENFVEQLIGVGCVKFLVTYTAQGRDPKDKETTVFLGGVISVA
jgi:hypothetical protein